MKMPTLSPKKKHCLLIQNNWNEKDNKDKFENSKEMEAKE
jgi:hypothetical protein